MCIYSKKYLIANFRSVCLYFFIGCSPVKHNQHQDSYLIRGKLLKNNAKRQPILLKFKSKATEMKYLTICHMLQNGNVSRALKRLLNTSRKETVVNCIKGIVKKELKCFARSEEAQQLFQGRKVKDLRSIDLESLTKTGKSRSPLVWALLTAAAGSKAREHKFAKKLLATFCMILNIHSIHMNTFQYMLAFAMYDNCLEKEGYNVLNVLGLTVSYQSLQTKLTDVREAGAATVTSWKQSLEEQHHELTLSEADHSYCARVEQTTSHRMPLFHEYGRSPTRISGGSLEPGYRLNLDNLDYYTKVRHMTEEHQNTLNHYIQVMAVRDRVNCEHLSDIDLIGNLHLLDSNAFIPSATDVSTLRKDIIQAVALTAVGKIDALKCFSDCVAESFSHEYSDEMSKKSVVVSKIFLALTNSFY